MDRKPIVNSNQASQNRNPLNNKVALAGVVIIIAILLIIGVAWSTIQNSESDVTYTFDIVLEKLSQPVGIIHANDQRLFINERNGVIRILDTGELLPDPFLDIQDRVNIEGNIEQGLLGLAFDPDYENNGTFYVTYTDADFTVHLERFQVTEDPDVADKESGEILLSIEQRTAAHNGGHIRFGSDGYLYMSVGDGGKSLNPESTGQYKDDLLGKILRLDVSGEAPYTIPTDNPFIDDPDARPEIWVLGLRNPWQFSFAPDSDAMFITDVGWSTYEEVNYQSADSTGGENYGWKLLEGDLPIAQPDYIDVPTVPIEETVLPIFFYPHATPDNHDGLSPVGCAVIGGFVYRGEALPDLKGKYLYGDFCHGQVWTLAQNGEQWETELLVETNLRITSLGEGIDGEIYLTSFLGEVRKLIIDSEGKYAPDGDIDFDLVENAVDNCRETGNPDQEDTWGDVGVGDACDQNYYTNGSSVFEIKVFQQHYGAFHVYGCQQEDCGFIASIESTSLSTDETLTVESENFAGWVVEAEYTSDSGNRAVYEVLVYDADGNIYVDNLQVLVSDNSLAWRTIS